MAETHSENALKGLDERHSKMVVHSKRGNNKLGFYNLCLMYFCSYSQVQIKVMTGRSPRQLLRVEPLQLFKVFDTQKGAPRKRIYVSLRTQVSKICKSN